MARNEVLRRQTGSPTCLDACVSRALQAALRSCDFGDWSCVCEDNDFRDVVLDCLNSQCFYDGEDLMSMLDHWCFTKPTSPDSTVEPHVEPTGTPPDAVPVPAQSVEGGNEAPDVVSNANASAVPTLGSDNASAGSDSNGGSNGGAIAGGVVGGLVLLALLGGLLFFLMRRQKQKRVEAVNPFTQTAPTSQLKTELYPTMLPAYTAGAGPAVPVVDSKDKADMSPDSTNYPYTTWVSPGPVENVNIPPASGPDAMSVYSGQRSVNPPSTFGGR